jgi:transcriptional regulator with GAF, ATPase, and Fis domain
VLQKVLRTIEMVAAARTPVLIEGESGVGKELLAMHAHRLSPRGAKGFVDLNCAAVPSSLLESELFGYERGAFTGAGNEKPGLVEVADGGTLFLDEVGEMIPEIQSKFLRVLDSGTFYRVGATRKRRADFRLVCATNRDLKGEVAAGRFRKDLFFRVNGVKVVIPPLRERPEDIPLLVDHFAKQLPNQKRFTPAALAALSEYDWPGNVRELHFAVERAGLLAEGEMIDLGDLPPEIVERTGRVPASVAVPAPQASPAAASAPEEPADESDEGPDLARVRAALEKAKWRREKAAEILGVSPRTLYRWIKKLGL